MRRRREFPQKVKLAAFERADKQCEECTAPLFPGKYHYDHRVPDALGGEPTLENCQVLCDACHAPKTAEDMGNIAKAKRREARHMGAKPKAKRPLRHPRLKRKVSGEVVERD